MRSVVLSSILLLIGALAFSSTAPAQGTGQFGTVTQGETKTYTNPSPGIPNPTTLDFYVICELEVKGVAPVSVFGFSASP